MQLIYNDFASFEIHLTGLRHLVETRGGIDNLGWDGFIKNAITGSVIVATHSGIERSVGSSWRILCEVFVLTFGSLESLWAYHENKKLSISTTEAKIKIEYPEHPFSPELCVTIAKLPEGFADLALSGVLSLQVIGLLSSITDWIRQMQGGWKKGVLPLGESNGTFLKQTHVCLELIPLNKLTVLEKVICVAMAAMTTETFNKNKQRNPVHRRLNDTLSENMFRYDLNKLAAESKIWLALVIAEPVPLPHPSSTESGTSLSRTESPRDILIDSHIRISSEARNWKWVKKNLQRYFYTEDLLVKWRRSWDAALVRYSTDRLK
jgi:hypothetical protein